MQDHMNFDYLRPGKAALMRESANCQRSSKKQLSHRTYNNATVLPTWRGASNQPSLVSGVVDEKGHIVTEYKLDNVIEKVDIPDEDVIYREETVVFCGLFHGQWGHFLADDISRLWYFIENDEHVDSYVFSVQRDNSSALQDNYLEFFKLLHIEHKIVFINKPTKFKRVIIPDKNIDCNPGEDYSEATLKRLIDLVIKNALEESNRPTIHEKVFLSRSHFGRSVATEPGIEMLDHYFSKNDYHIVHPQEVSLSDLIWILNNASEIATFCGSIAHNLIFARDGSRVINVERRSRPELRRVARHCFKKFQVTYIDAHYAIYPVHYGGGPFLIAYTEQFRRFSADNGFSDPDAYYMSDAYLYRCIDKYLNIYNRKYGIRMGIQPKDVKYGNSFYESYLDSKGVFDLYLSDKKVHNRTNQLKIRLAGYSIDLAHPTNHMEIEFSDYLENPDMAVDFSIDVEGDELRTKQPSGLAEAYHLELLKELIKRQVVLTHSSSFSYRGKAYMLLAESGGGKSTLARLFNERFSEETFIINDDHPFLKFTDDGIYVCGSPWRGKHDLGCDAEVPLHGIYILSKSRENILRRADSQEFCKSFFQAVTFNTTKPDEVKIIFQLFNRIFSDIPVYHFSFIDSEESADVLHRSMGKGD